MTPPVILSVSHLTVRYGSTVAVGGLCLEVRHGEVYGLVGPNGSGKSSTLSAIAGTLQPGSGSVRVMGLTRDENPVRYLTSVGLVPQELALYEEMDAADNLSFFGKLYGLRGRELTGRVAEALEFVHLTEQARQKVRTISVGMQRRLNLACALVHRPALLLLDEPTVGLDISSRDAILDRLGELRGRGTAMVFCSHHLHEVERLCDRIGLMHHGRLVSEGTLEQLDERAARSPANSSRLEHVYLRLTGGQGGGS